MERIKRILAVLAFTALAVLCAPCKAQEARSLPSSPEPIPVTRRAAPRPMPFSLDGDGPEAALIDFRSVDQINQQDRELWAEARTSIRERADIAGMDFNQSSWEVRQIVCSALPAHLFLTFTRDSGTSVASAFTASIPRGPGQLRVIPILRRGYSPYSPAPVNEQTLSAFNHLRAEEHPAQPPEWLATGLCYAALAGAHPAIALTGNLHHSEDSNAAPASLTVSPDSGGQISFIDLNANPQRALWTMSFDGNGKLLKVTQSAAPKSRRKVIQTNPAKIHERLVPQSSGIQGKPVPQSKAVPRAKPVPATEPVAKILPAQ